MTDFFNLPSKAGQDTQNQYLSQIAQHLGVTAGNLQDAINMANQANQAAAEKITDLETRFQTLTAEQQQDAEVIDARDGETSLRARLDRDHAEFASHMAENVSHLIETARDVSISGVQTITLPFKPKSLICIASIELQKAFSIGFWAENNAQFVKSICLDISETFNNNQIVYLRNASGYILAKIQNVTETGFEINWGVSTGISGTATLYILASTH